MVIVHYENLSQQEKDNFDKTIAEAKAVERKWFKDRGLSEADVMYGDTAFKEYLRVESGLVDNRPWDKAPGFRRVFIMGYVYGRRK